MDEDKKVFVAELHNGFQDLAQIDEKALIKRAYCYILLADGIILHPAYVWLSRVSNELVLCKLAEFFRPPFCDIALGDSSSIPDYMNQRIERLREGLPDGSTQEALKYAKWESLLLEQAKKLDKTFPERSQLELGQSRDAKFRELLTADLASALDPASLLNQVHAHADEEHLKIDHIKVPEQLVRFVEADDLVSLETFANRVRTVGMPALVEQDRFKKRMLTLYYHANIQQGIHLPAGAALSENSVVDPFDADVFWSVFERLFGKKPTRFLSTATDPQLVRMLRELRETDLWREFRKAYFQVLHRLDDELRANASRIAQKMRIETGEQELGIVRRLWQNRKTEIASCVFGAIALSTASPIIMAAGGLSVFFSAWRLPGAIKKFLDDYRQHDLPRLREKIRRELERLEPK